MVSPALGHSRKENKVTSKIYKHCYIVIIFPKLASVIYNKIRLFVRIQNGDNLSIKFLVRR